ncbi:unnamed protein product [Heligmosomoides polygyrus]|uniref:60S ribosomal protein L37a n=1 Tax=Heligmosomoides polygyrus TaxID=6339 RepID=A0A183FGT8_HELPZ|nr:unnamed protein product [Heligmosomoides polygyrus]
MSAAIPKQLMIVLQNGSYKVLSLGADVLPEYKLQPTRIHHCTIVHYRVIMAKRTKKVGIVGKYDTRYGASLRKMVKKMKVIQHSWYTCVFCGKEAMSRKAVGIWSCSTCHKTVARGAYVYGTVTAATARSIIGSLRNLKE